MSQSLWVRDRFLIDCVNINITVFNVAIPLGQGQVFNKTMNTNITDKMRRNPFGSGTGF